MKNYILLIYFIVIFILKFNALATEANIEIHETHLESVAHSTIEHNKVLKLIANMAQEKGFDIYLRGSSAYELLFFAKHVIKASKPDSPILKWKVENHFSNIFSYESDFTMHFSLECVSDCSNKTQNEYELKKQISNLLKFSKVVFVDRENGMRLGSLNQILNDYKVSLNRHRISKNTLRSVLYNQLYINEYIQSLLEAGRNLRGDLLGNILELIKFSSKFEIKLPSILAQYIKNEIQNIDVEKMVNQKDHNFKILNIFNVAYNLTHTYNLLHEVDPNSILTMDKNHGFGPKKASLEYFYSKAPLRFEKVFRPREYHKTEFVNHQTKSLEVLSAIDRRYDGLPVTYISRGNNYFSFMNFAKNKDNGEIAVFGNGFYTSRFDHHWYHNYYPYVLEFDIDQKAVRGLDYTVTERIRVIKNGSILRAKKPVDYISPLNFFEAMTQLDFLKVTHVFRHEWKVIVDFYTDPKARKEVFQLIKMNVLNTDKLENLPELFRKSFLRFYIKDEASDIMKIYADRLISEVLALNAQRKGAVNLYSEWLKHSYVEEFKYVVKYHLEHPEYIHNSKRLSEVNVAPYMVNFIVNTPWFIELVIDLPHYHDYISLMNELKIDVTMFEKAYKEKFTSDKQKDYSARSLSINSCKYIYLH